MTAAFQSRYTPLDRKALATQCILQMFDRDKTRIQQQISEAEYFAITMDLWTFRAKRAWDNYPLCYQSI